MYVVAILSVSISLSFVRLSAGVVDNQQGILKEHKDNERDVQRGYFADIDQLREDVESVLRSPFLTTGLVREFIPQFLDGNVLTWESTLIKLRQQGDYVCLRQQNDQFCREVETTLLDVAMGFRNPQGDHSLVEDSLQRIRAFAEPHLKHFLKRHPDQLIRLSSSSSLQSSAPTSQPTLIPSDYADAWTRIILSAKGEIDSSGSAVSGSAASRLSELVGKLAQKWAELKKAMDERRQEHASVEQEGSSAQPPPDTSNQTSEPDLIALAALMLKLNY